jgi:hypothetical protein
MLPDSEIDRLMDAVDEAIGLAAEGKVGEGYRLLSEGRIRASELAKAREPWGAELVHRWRLACDNYAASYGVELR